MLDLQHVDAELQRRRDAVQLAVGLIGRDQVGDVAHDEQLARRGVEDQGGIGAAVGAGHDQGVRLLPVRGQGLVLGAFGRPPVLAEAVIALEQFIGHERLPRPAAVSGSTPDQDLWKKPWMRSARA
ncbi:hypothetical protein D3C78_1670350 [compost metagenome]